MKLYPRLKAYFNYKESLALLNPFNKAGAVQRFEDAFAKKFESQHAIMFAHGRTGIYALMKAWKLESAEVICPAYTCVVVQHAIVLSGNIPVFVDSEKDSWNMNLELLESTITNRTRLIVATHLFGYPMDVEKLKKIVAKAEHKYGHKIFVLQDMAHSYAAKWDDKMVGTFGDASVYGMNISKIMSSIFGGMVCTNSDELSEQLRMEAIKFQKGNKWIKSLKRIAYYFTVRVAFNSYIYGIINWMERKGLLDSFVQYYEDEKIYFPSDWNSKPTNTEAVVGMVQLKKYDEIIKKRRKRALEWKDQFTADESIRFMQDMKGATYSHCVALVEDREKWIEKYRKKQIQLGILIEYSVPEMPAFKQFRQGEYPIAKYFSEHSINFPNWPD